MIWVYFGTEVLRPEDARSKKLQEAVDRVSESVRKRYAAFVEANQIPKPQAVAVHWDKVGGHVTPLEVCYRVPVVVGGAENACEGDTTFTFDRESRMNLGNECGMEKQCRTSMSF